MPFLLDTNCWMQIVRDRQYASDVRSILTEIPPDQIFITDFALHTVAILMQRHRVLDGFSKFIHGVGIGHNVGVLGMTPQEFPRIANICSDYRLDVEDAYQYEVAEINGLKLVSLDSDFDRTPRGRLTPAQALQQFKDDQQNT